MPFVANLILLVMSTLGSWKANQASYVSHILHKETKGFATRAWFLYVRRMLFARFSGDKFQTISHGDNTGVVFIIKGCVQLSQIYLYRSRSVADLTPGVEIRGSACDPKSEPSYKFRGDLPLHTYVLAGKGRHPHRAHFHIMFNTHKELALNLTFPLIYFSSVLCQLGTLILVDVNLRFCTCRTVVMAQHYSRSHKLRARLSIGAGVIYQIHLMYTVIDQGLLYTWHPDTVATRFFGKIQSLPMRFIIKRENNIQPLAFFHATGEKFQQITISVFDSAENIYSVHEGPGLLGNSLTPQRLNQKYFIYETTTFQAIIVSRFKPNLFQYFKPGYRLQFQALKPNKLSSLSEGHAISFVYSTMLRGPKTVIWLPRAVHNTFVEVVISNLTFVGMQSNISECREAGFAWFNVSKYKLSEIKTVCRTQNADHHYSKIHSATNELLLVFYAFHGYLREFTIHITASASKCFSVSIDPCWDYISSSVIVKNEIKPEITTEKFRARNTKHFRERKIEYFTVLLEKHGCVVLQINSPGGHTAQIKCHVRVKPGGVTKHNHILQYQVEGFLQGYKPLGRNYGAYFEFLNFITDDHLLHLMYKFTFHFALKQIRGTSSHLRFTILGLVFIVLSIYPAAKMLV